ncbi:MAG: type II toxin-antitoxin system VapC family toxin [Betaproteobacteria bacterium]|nr:type II toxin-antitoxin system VapC family toxin [Betaproteobacteria bacterium]
MRYMLDTNICIYLMKRHPAAALQRLEALHQGDAVISVVTLAELRAGLEMHPASRDHNAQVLSALTARIPVLPFDEAAAESYGVLRAAVRERNRDALDRLIAAHAVSAGTILVTNNEADFRGYPGLVVENWASAAAS